MHKRPMAYILPQISYYVVLKELGIKELACTTSAQPLHNPYTTYTTPTQPLYTTPLHNPFRPTLSIKQNELL